MSSSPNTCKIVVGRLVEIHVSRGYNTPEDVDEMIELIRGTVSQVPPAQKVVIAADWRNVRLMSPPTAERARAMLAGVSPRIERSVIILQSDRQVGSMQVARLVRESAHPERRATSDLNEAFTYLDAVLVEDERARLRAFLA